MIGSDDESTTGSSKEFQEWFLLRKQALQFKSDLRADGGHVMLRAEVYDPKSLEEPLRSEALSYFKLKQS